MPVDIKRLREVNLELAEELRLIRLTMIAFNLNPMDIPIMQSKMHEIETKIRMIGSDVNDVIPFVN